MNFDYVSDSLVTGTEQGFEGGIDKVFARYKSSGMVRLLGWVTTEEVAKFSRDLALLIDERERSKSLMSSFVCVTSCMLFLIVS